MTKSEKAQDRRLKLLYRISLEEQKKIEEYQRKYGFGILMGNNMGTDHCHASGLIRGRLDWRINKAYGLLENIKDKHLPDVLRALANYHESPPAVSAIGFRYGLIGRAKRKRKMVYGPPKDLKGINAKAKK